MPGLPQFDLERVVVAIIAILIAITVHEFMHAWTAWRLGDDTARLLGRISLNPAVHFDPIGFILFIMIAFGYPVIAWGKPVPVNPYNLRPLGRLGKRGSMGLVALAGPLSNVAMALAAAIPLRVADQSAAALGTSGFFLSTFVTLNLWLAAFNMIPIPPLDGSKILTGILPRFWIPILVPLERYGFAILLVLVFVGGVGTPILGAMINPVFSLLSRVVYGA